jgi:hypothetical protein
LQLSRAPTAPWFRQTGRLRWSIRYAVTITLVAWVARATLPRAGTLIFWRLLPPLLSIQVAGTAKVLGLLSIQSG